mmetsp:Transcript_9699/g.21990  ORF Transcript_9699/g.21990 Transcript_9699/m.21990 type:complete len:80 (+) Transcript_9699:346-585(+)
MQIKKQPFYSIYEIALVEWHRAHWMLIYGAPTRVVCLCGLKRSCKILLLHLDVCCRVVECSKLVSGETTKRAFGKQLRR